ncbi:MAG TPA: alpha/beta hydrolase [Sphingomicrobium sp.]|nr:alpha/beta hydrolase [Sphingomicrobium sp.]
MPAPDAAPVSGVTWEDRYWTSRDGLKLHYRDYAGRTDRPPLLMLHGLTRNSRDFENVAARYAGDWRVIAVDFRGRGQSARDPNSAQYVPGTYAADVIQLLDELGVGEAVFLGTSLGGLVTMIVAQVAPERIAGVLLNDVGPELDLSGIDRIKTYVGKPVVFRDWDEVVDTLQDRTGDVHPRYGRAEWLRFAKRICRQTAQGVEFDYDMAIADPFNAGNTGEVSDGWPYYRVLAGRPILVLRGETSDLLSDAAAQRMATEIPDVEVVTVPRVGHAPDLDEPEAIDGIDRLLERVLKR